MSLANTQADYALGSFKVDQTAYGSNAFTYEESFDKELFEVNLVQSSDFENDEDFLVATDQIRQGVFENLQQIESKSDAQLIEVERETDRQVTVFLLRRTFKVIFDLSSKIVEIMERNCYFVGMEVSEMSGIIASEIVEDLLNEVF